jgi:hypothetical protein
MKIYMHKDSAGGNIDEIDCPQCGHIHSSSYNHNEQDGGIE